MSEDQLYAAGATASYAEAAASLIRAAARASEAGFDLGGPLRDAITAACDAVTRAAGGEVEPSISPTAQEGEWREMFEERAGRVRAARASIDAEVQRLERALVGLGHGTGFSNETVCRRCEYTSHVAWLTELRNMLNGEGEE